MGGDPLLIKIFEVHCDFYDIIIHRSADYLPIDFSMGTIREIAKKRRIGLTDVDRYLLVLVKEINDDKKVKYLKKPEEELNEKETIIIFNANIPSRVNAFFEKWCTGEQNVFK
jgi:hypothetical protein